jgi:phosphoglycerate dehydrogenase-like enzyme
MRGSLEGVVLTPHSAGVTREALESGLRLSTHNVWNFLDGRPTHVVISGDGAR